MEIPVEIGMNSSTVLIIAGKTIAEILKATKTRSGASLGMVQWSTAIHMSLITNQLHLLPLLMKLQLIAQHRHEMTSKTLNI
jgi:hypothetical protein